MRTSESISWALAASTAFAAAPKADIEKGKEYFTNACGICHSTTKEPGGSTQGPNLAGVVGRKAASQKDFPWYSPALKAYRATWSMKSLSDFLANPSIKVPMTTMPMLIADNKIRAGVVAYLATLK